MYDLKNRVSQKQGSRAQIYLAVWLFALTALLPRSSAQGLIEMKGDFKYQAPLGHFMSENQQIMLRSTRGEYYIDLPVADRLELKSALLHLEYVNSISLLDERSQLRVELNDQIVAQVPLFHKQPEGVIDLRLPVERLKAGYNKLHFIVAQHFTLKCEDPSAPELWTQINTENSFLTFEGTQKALPLNLSELASYFDSKKWGTQQLNLVVPSVLESDQALKWGSLVSQGVALRLDYVPLQISVSNLPVSGDNVIIGTSAQLSAVLSPEQINAIQGSYLGLMPSSGGPANFNLIISGRNDEEVTRAATAFCYLNFPLPDSPSLVIQDLELPLATARSGRSTINENNVYLFSELGFTTATVKGINRGLNTGVFALDLNSPPDLYAHEDAQMELLLHFAHGAAFRQDCVLNISINDIFERAIQLNDEGGAAYRNYKVEIPLRSLRPGRNILKLTPQMIPLITDFCTVIQEENLLFTLFDDSKIKIPEAAHFVKLPDLNLFSRTSFPFSSKTDGSELSVQVVTKDYPTISAAWTLLAKLAQKTGLPMQNVEVSSQPSASARNIVIVGSLNQIPPNVLNAAPLGLGEIKRFAYEQRLTQVSSLKDTGMTLSASSQAIVQGKGELGQFGVAMEFASPFAGNKTVLLVTAGDSALLAKRVSELVDPSYWNLLRGDVNVWSDLPATLASENVGKSYFLGADNLPARFEYLFSNQPLLWLAIILVTLMVFACLTWFLLKRLKQSQHGQAPEMDAK